MIKLKKPMFLLAAIVLITLVACFSTGILLVMLGLAYWLSFLIGSLVVVTGVYAYHKAALLILMIKLNEEFYL